MIVSRTGPDTDNVSPFPNSRCAKEPDAVRDATLDFTAAVRLSTVVPDASDVDDDNTVAGVVLD